MVEEHSGGGPLFAALNRAVDTGKQFGESTLERQFRFNETVRVESQRRLHENLALGHQLATKPRDLTGFASLFVQTMSNRQARALTIARDALASVTEQTANGREEARAIIAAERAATDAVTAAARRVVERDEDEPRLTLQPVVRLLPGAGERADQADGSDDNADLTRRKTARRASLGGTDRPHQPTARRHAERPSQRREDRGRRGDARSPRPSSRNSR